MKYCFGVDLGGTTVKMGVFQEDGKVIDKWEIKTRTENGGEAILPDIAVSIDGKMKEHGFQKEDMLGIGIGVPAPVRADGSVPNTVNLGWGYKAVKKELEELTGLEVAVGNDANVAALGELWLGGGKGHKDMIMVTLGTGVGGGVIIDGKCVVGAHGAGGEFGHMTVDFEEQEAGCGCGRKGCLEMYASATGITRLANRRLAKDDAPSTLRGVKEMSAKEVFDAVKAGDTVAIEIAEQFGTYLGKALVNLTTVTDPAIIVIGGGVSKAGEILLDYIRKPFMENAYYANMDTEFVLAELGNDAGICGAAKLVLDAK